MRLGCLHVLCICVRFGFGFAAPVLTMPQLLCIASCRRSTFRTDRGSAEAGLRGVLGGDSFSPNTNARTSQTIQPQVAWLMAAGGGGPILLTASGSCSSSCRVRVTQIEAACMWLQGQARDAAVRTNSTVLGHFTVLICPITLDSQGSQP